MPENTAQPTTSSEPKRKLNFSTKLKIVDLLRPHKKFHLHVNEIYAESIPYTSLPPAMLKNLPKLPEEVAYRASSDLVLLDVKANLVVDYLPGVLPVEAMNGR